jgi:hypothetical protein
MIWPIEVSGASTNHTKCGRSKKRVAHFQHNNRAARYHIVTHNAGDTELFGHIVRRRLCDVKTFAAL